MYFYVFLLSAVIQSVLTSESTINHNAEMCKNECQKYGSKGVLIHETCQCNSANDTKFPNGPMINAELLANLKRLIEKEMFSSKVQNFEKTSDILIRQLRHQNGVANMKVPIYYEKRDPQADAAKVNKNIENVSSESSKDPSSMSKNCPLLAGLNFPKLNLGDRQHLTDKIVRFLQYMPTMSGLPSLEDMINQFQLPDVDMFRSLIYLKQPNRLHNLLSNILLTPYQKSSNGVQNLQPCSTNK